MVEIKSSEYRICDFCGDMHNYLMDITAIDGKTITICKDCRLELVTKLIHIVVD